MTATSNQASTSTTASAAAAGQPSNSICLPIRDILAHRSTMFNYKLPSDRTMYESSLIYCNLCDYSCDLTDKSFIICHYLAKHPDDNIVYSYLWPQMEQTPNTMQYKIKYYLIKAHLKIRNKEPTTTTHTTTETNFAALDLDKIVFPASLLTDSVELTDQEPATGEDTIENVNSLFVLNKMIDWLDKTLTQAATITTTTTTTTTASPEASASQEDVQELEEEQEVTNKKSFQIHFYCLTQK
jgi:hypothetical protein